MFGDIFDVEEYLANEPLLGDTDLPMEFEWGKDNDVVISTTDETDLILGGVCVAVGVGLLAYSLSGLSNKK